ncbi:MAG: hypothetical protein GY720_08640 [bacterium]|nr:hypothetical protein [bacterium]
MADRTPIFRSPVRRQDARGRGTKTGAPVGSVVVEDVSTASKVLHNEAPAGTEDTVAGVGHAARLDERIIYSVAPGEWLELSAHSPKPDGSISPTAIDVTHARALLRVTGTDAANTLEKICALDFDNRFTPSGAAARTSVAAIAAEVIRLDRDGSPSYLICCSRSYGDYLHGAITDAATQFAGQSVEWDGSL